MILKALKLLCSLILVLAQLLSSEEKIDIGRKIN